MKYIITIEYQELFDRFEYLLALIHADMRERRNMHFWGPVGRFGWKYRVAPEDSPMEKIAHEVASAGKNWPLLRDGLFDGSLERFQSVKARFDQLVGQLPWY